MEQVEREVGGGNGMGNTCKPMAVSFQCMTKFTTNKKYIYIIFENVKKKKTGHSFIFFIGLSSFPSAIFEKLVLSPLNILCSFFTS